MQPKRVLFPGLVLFSLCSMPALATENGLLEYPIGVNTVLPGILPPPGGTEFYNYTQYYDGQASVGPTGDKLVPGFHANVGVDALRLLHTWRFLAGPFTLTSGIVTPILTNDLHVAGRSGNAFGLLDLTLQPAYLGYVNPAHTVFTYAGLDVFLPTADYNVRNIVNLGNNYYTFSPNGAVTWFATPRLQASVEIQAEAHTLNTATNYQSGASVNFDNSVEYAPFLSVPKLHFGLQGYYFQQVTDDRLDGRVYRDGYRGRAFAAGPQIRYDWTGGGITAKWQHEFAVENRTKGDRFWIQFALPVNFLSSTPRHIVRGDHGG